MTDKKNPHDANAQADVDAGPRRASNTRQTPGMYKHYTLYLIIVVMSPRLNVVVVDDLLADTRIVQGMNTIHCTVLIMIVMICLRLNVIVPVVDSLADTRNVRALYTVSNHSGDEPQTK